MLALGFVAAPTKITALSGSEFQAGRIMDDGVFFNGNGMSMSQIQEFLNAKVPACDTNGQKTIYDSAYKDTVTRKVYAERRGVSTPFTCLKDFRQDTGNKVVESGLCNGHSAGNKSAAQIIYEVSLSCGVNPKVMLVLLQKEQTLVTDDWPWPIQYRSATGFGCPDTAPCDAEYYGFFNQVYHGARQFKRYALYPNSYNYIAGRNNYILYNPNSSCGGSTVYIQNQATAGLYVYTPYQPNQAALNNLYGTGDSCSAYGNRNFWRMYNDWFGSTFAAPYYSSFIGQGTYPTLEPGSQASSYILFKNHGTLAWYDDTSISQAPAGTNVVHLAATNPINRTSAFGASWPSASRPAVNFSKVYENDGQTLAANQHIALPGQIVKFEFAFTAPTALAPGTYREHFQLVAEGTIDGAFNNQGAHWNVTVNAKQAISWVSQSEYPTIAPADNKTSTLRLKNSGNVPLYDDTTISQAPSGSYPVHLATASPLNRLSNFAADWPSQSRASNNFAAVYNQDGTTLAANQHTAQPGQIIEFRFNHSVPENFSSNVYREYYQPILEGTSDGYFPPIGIYYDVTVPVTPVIKYTEAPAAIDMVANRPSSLSLTVKNVGNAQLPSDTKIYTPNGAAFRSSSWINDSTVGTLGSILHPAQSKTLTLPMLAPDTSNLLHSKIDLEFRGADAAILHGSNRSVSAKVADASYRVAFAGQSNYPVLTYGQTRNITFQYKNSGNQIWYDAASINEATTRSPYSIHLATVLPFNRLSGFIKNWPIADRPAVNFTAVHEADGTTLASSQHVAQPGQIVTFTFAVSPAEWVNPGIYREHFQPIAEGSPDGRLNLVGTYQDIHVLTPTYKISYVSQSPYPSLRQGQQGAASLTFKNIGTAPWFDNTSTTSAPSNTRPVHLATSNHLNRNSIFGSSWPSPNRPAINFAKVYESDGTTLAPDQHVAQPGQIVKFEFMISVPNGTGSGKYREYFQVIAEGTADGLFNSLGAYLDVTVQ